MRLTARYFELVIEELPEGRWVCREKMSPHFWMGDTAEECAAEALKSLTPKLRLRADGGDGKDQAMEWNAVL
ncbi:hypothetical protein UFOVP1244_17 [uncultured Caudovirales phage]|uniref:Uncharacterized protein n=1 Tax=uncultured Caudovirales phage TaxID=2100421 RepID=A0A6J5RCV8_9CAUD|nr:hypothetical protein UFOVP1244_17 [uncultured Caudovirales phage]